MFSVAIPTFALLKRELLVQLRMKRTFFWLLVLAVVTSWFLIVEWPSSDFVNWTRAARYAETVTVIVTCSAFVGSALFIPGIAAASVVVEKEQGNWDSLYLTLISPKGIVLGKFLSAVTLYMLYIFALMPMLAVVFFLVGVDWSQFISLFVFILTTTGTLGVIGIACSVTCRKTVWAVVCSYIGMTVVMGLPLIPVGFVIILTESTWLENLAEDYIVVLSGYIAFAGLVEGSGAFSAISEYWHFAYQGLLATAAIWWTLRVVQKPAKPPVVLQEKPIDDAVALKKRQRSFPFYLIDPLRRAKPIGDRINPMYAREMRCGLLLRRTSSVRLTYAFVLGLWVISAFAALNVDSERDFELSWLLCLIGHGALICAFIPAFLANLFAKENELANVDMLLMTSMTPEEIAKGKMYAAIRRVGTFLIGSIAANSIMLRLAYAWDQSIPLVVAGQFTLCLCAALVLVATMWASILSKRTAPAIIASFVFSALSLCGVLILFAVVFATLGINFPPDPWAYLSPVFAYIEVFDDRTRRQGPIPEGWFACMAIHALAVCGLYIRAIRYYAARVSTKRSLELPV